MGLSLRVPVYTCCLSGLVWTLSYGHPTHNPFMAHNVGESWEVCFFGGGGRGQGEFHFFREKFQVWPSANCVTAHERKMGQLVRYFDFCTTAPLHFCNCLPWDWVAKNSTRRRSLLYPASFFLVLSGWYLPQLWYSWIQSQLLSVSCKCFKSWAC